MDHHNETRGGAAVLVVLATFSLQFVYPAPGHTPSALTILGSTWASVTPPTVTPTP
jgi:hypothetical protein